MDRIRQTCERRLQERYSASEYLWAALRLNRELKFIREHGQAEAFEAATTTAQGIRDQGHSCRLTGAGCCCLVAYLMDLSDVDPVEHGLPFERFLDSNQGRTVHFTFVMARPTLGMDETANGASTDGSPCTSEAVTIHPANALEAVPCLVERRIRRQQPSFRLNAIGTDDAAAFALLRSGNTAGISQLDGTSLDEVLPALEPRSLIDIAAITAAYRGEAYQPGLVARYINRAFSEEARRLHWIAEATLRETRGMILFQEQIMLLLNRLADIPPADGYAFIRAVKKRQWEETGTFAEWFTAEADKAGLEERDSGELFETIRDAAAWAVCKGHHLAQAVTTYQAAYLKAHFPEEFDQELKLVQH